MSAFEKLLMCRVKQINVNKNKVTFHFPLNNYCDAEGAIKLAKFFCDKVTKIDTYSGNNLTTSYVLKKDKTWTHKVWSKK